MKIRREETVSIIAALLLFGMALLSGCATAPKVAYETLDAMGHWVQTAAQELPPSCATIQRTALAVTADRAKFDAFKAQTRQRCDAALTALQTATAALQTAQQGIHDLAAGVKSPKDLTAWVALAWNLYGNLVGVLEPLGVKLPGVK